MNPVCRWCGLDIESCDGAYGDWMHTRSRAEHCHTAMHTADPETPNDVSHAARQRRANARRRRLAAAIAVDFDKAAER